MLTKNRSSEIAELLCANALLEEGYSYAWFQRIGGVSLSPLKAGDHFEKEGILEARIFAPGKELHIFQFDGGLRMVETLREETDRCIEEFVENGNPVPICKDEVDFYFRERQVLRGKYGKSLTLCHYLAFDEDGQASIRRTVFEDFEGGKGNA